MKFDKRQILRNVGSSWFALGVNVVSGIFPVKAGKNGH